MVFCLIIYEIMDCETGARASEDHLSNQRRSGSKHFLKSACTTIILEEKDDYLGYIDFRNLH